MKTLEILAISDLYGEYNILENLLFHVQRRLSTNRITIIAGDLGLHPERAQYQYDIERIFDILSEISELIIYVPGDTDSKNLNIQRHNVVNVDRSYKVINIENMSLGIFGLGGAVKNSVREGEPTPYLWDENIPLVKDGLTTELKINIEKVMLERPDFAILVTHSPPYGIADLSKPITLNEMLILHEIATEEEIEEEENEIEKEKKKPKYTSPRRLGSRLVRNFIKYYQPDIHISGHVHKQGGKQRSLGDTLCFNVSHLSPMPYKLTGRKFLVITLQQEKISPEFDNVVRKNLDFDTFIETYI